MKKVRITLLLAVVTTLGMMCINANAQNVEVNAIGSSALFLDAGLAASSITSGVIQAPCVWTTNNVTLPASSPSNIVVAVDTSTSSGPLSDAGLAWVAWTTGSGGTCARPNSDAVVYSYLETDSVVGTRCLFNANLPSGPSCTIFYPTGNPNPSNVLYPLNDATRVETALPPAIANALNATKVNVAGTDIRPEDAWFATKRALTPCGVAISVPNGNQPSALPTQYLGLGYVNGQAIQSEFGNTPLHVIDFTLPTQFGNMYAVTPIGAAPILVVVNGPSSGFGAPGGFSDISSATLAHFLDGRLSLTNQVNGVSSGNPVNTIIHEPLSGTYNVVEYNVPNRTVPSTDFQTSQDVGINQPVAQRNCNDSGMGPLTGFNPMNIFSVAGGARQRAIGTGQALSQVAFENTHDTLSYGFWSVANFDFFSASQASAAKYLTVDTVDPLVTISSNHTGTVPLTGSADLANVTLANISSGTYPLWSILRLLTANSMTAPAAATNLANSIEEFVTFGTATSRPDFIIVPNLRVVRSHFVPPAPDPVVSTPPGMNGQPSPAANGHLGTSINECSIPEQGGDVGGVVFTLVNDAVFCSSPTHPKTGQTGQRR